MSQEFKKAFRGVDSAIKQGTARALNRALSSTKTRVVRQLREDTGLKTDVIKSRTRSRTANQNRLGVILGIAVKYAIGLAKFSPKEKSVKRGKRIYQGVTAKIGRQARQLVPGGFLLPGTGIVIGRRGKDKYPTVQLKTEIFTESAKAQEAPMKQHLLDTFDKIVAHEIDFSIQRKFNENK